MNSELEKIPLEVNEAKNRFELPVMEYISFILYSKEGNRLGLTHTEVPVPIENHGVAAVLTEKTLQYAKDNDFKVLPFCPYISAYIQRNPQWIDVVDPEFIR